MYLIFYDIALDRLRNKISKLLVEQGYERLQYSVFIGPYDPKNNKVWKTAQAWLQDAPNEKLYCLKISKQNFYNIKTIGTLAFDLEYLTGEQRSLII